jgi:hypothetical protein
VAQKHGKVEIGKWCMTVDDVTWVFTQLLEYEDVRR